MKEPPNQIATMLGLSTVPNLEPRYNIAPTQDVVAVRMENGARALVRLRWGLVPFWAKDAAIGAKMINARADTLAEKPAFRQAFQRRRCVIAADGFYEWKTIARARIKQPFHIRRPDGAPFAFAGLWERWEKGDEPLETCTIVTTDAPESLTEIHHRVPVILSEEAMAAWLETPEGEADGLADLLKPLPDGALIAQPVSTLVNKVANDGPELLEPVEIETEDNEPSPPKAQGDLFG